MRVIIFLLLLTGCAQAELLDNGTLAYVESEPQRHSGNARAYWAFSHKTAEICPGGYVQKDARMEYLGNDSYRHTVKIRCTITHMRSE